MFGQPIVNSIVIMDRKPEYLDALKAVRGRVMKEICQGNHVRLFSTVREKLSVMTTNIFKGPDKSNTNVVVYRA